MNNSLPLLFAVGLNDLIFIIVAALVSLVIVGDLKQIDDAKKKQVAATAGAASRCCHRKRPGRPEWQAGPAPADPLRAQIDEFLRRAGQAGKPPQARRAATAAASAGRPRRDRGAARRYAGRTAVESRWPEPLRSLGPPPQRCVPQRRGPNRRAQPAAPPRRVAPQRRSRWPSTWPNTSSRRHKQIREEVSHLGERVKQADEQFDVQLQQKFDHELGSLAGRHASRVERSTGAGRPRFHRPRKSPPCSPARTACVRRSCSTKSSAGRTIAGNAQRIRQDDRILQVRQDAEMYLLALSNSPSC